MKEENKQESPKKAIPSRGYVKFIKAANLDKDPVLVVLRVHLLVESYINQIIVAKVPRGDKIIQANFTFAQKVIVLESLDFVKQGVIDSIKAVNHLRNECSHTMEYLIHENDIDKIGLPFGRQYIKMKKDKDYDQKVLLANTLMMLVAKLDAFSEASLLD